MKIKKYVKLVLVILGVIILFSAVDAFQPAVRLSEKIKGELEAASGWFQVAHDPQHTSRTTAIGPAIKPKIKWSYVPRDRHNQPGGSILSMVIGSDGTIYLLVYFEEDPLGIYVQAINPNKSIKWNKQLEYNHDDNAAMAMGNDGTLFITSGGDGLVSLTAVKPLDGSVKWQKSLGGKMDNSGDNDRAITVAGDGTLYIQKAGDTLTPELIAATPEGEVKWRFPSYRCSCQINPTVGTDGTVYMVSYNEGTKKAIFNAIEETGKVKWNFVGPDDTPFASAVAADGTIYATNSRLYAFSPEGKLKWSNNAGAGYQNATVAIGMDGTLYTGGNSDLLLRHINSRQKSIFRYTDIF